MNARHPIAFAMAGGGPGALIGPVHRMAAELDGRFRLVAGAFSRNAERNSQAGSAWGIDPARIYPDAATLAAAEANREDGAKLLVVATPNDHHLAAASAALAAGLHVMSDKPAALDLNEARLLADRVRASGCVYGLTMVYSGYPMVREARELIRSGAVGNVRKVVVEYTQGWLSQPLERQGNRQAAWRADPARAGAGGCIADIGSHAFHLAEFVTGDRVHRVLADIGTVVPGRRLDDDCCVLLRFHGGARGVLMASQISTGARNAISIKVHGDQAGLIWSHERPDQLVIDRLDGSREVRFAGASSLSAAASSAARLPAGHPEGFIEALANLYADLADAILARPQRHGLLPDMAEGVRGMAFIEKSLSANVPSNLWIELGDAA